MSALQAVGCVTGIAYGDRCVMRMRARHREPRTRGVGSTATRTASRVTHRRLHGDASWMSAVS